MKKRYIVIPCVLGLVALSFLLPPVRPAIQLPGEVYPGTENWPLFGLFGGLTNTFVASMLAWILVLAIGLSAGAGSKKADEVPSGYYNFIEMILEGAYNFAANIAGEKRIKDFFPFFMTFILFILVSNWMGLIPGVDSIGLWEHRPTYLMHKAEKAGKEFDFAKADAANNGDLRDGLFLLRKDKFVVEGAPIVEVEAHVIEGHAAEGTDSHAAEGTEDHSAEGTDSHAVEGTEDHSAEGTESHATEGTEDHSAEGEHAVQMLKAGRSAESADWTIVPFVRPAATDLNFTLAFAIIAMAMVQYFGVKYLGFSKYMSKFFPFIDKNFPKLVAKNPVRAADIIVGLLEFIGEFSKVISFAFRLLGNIFAGMVLLFVMAFLLPAVNVVFFGLEFFVGLIQAFVFGLLMLIFMVGATHSHGGHDDHHAEEAHH